MFAIVDCNNFYVSCEQVFNPQLVGKPVVVLSNNDGCVISRSNEAKQAGIRMGEPVFLMEDIIKKEKIITCSSNYTLYGDMSSRVLSAISSIVPDPEVYSIDEVFLELSPFVCRNDLSAFARSIRERVFRWTGIPVSVGIAGTKTLAKIAVAIAKDMEGTCVLKNTEQISNALASFPVENVWGIGHSYRDFLFHCGIHTASDLCRADLNWVKRSLTITGMRTVMELRGTSCIPLEKNPALRKNICTARSFGKMTGDAMIISEAVSNFASSCARRLRQQKAMAQQLTVFLETNRFREELPQYSNAATVVLPVPTNTSNQIIEHAIRALQSIYKKGFLYKKAGVLVEKIIPSQHKQKSLFADPSDHGHEKAIWSIDQLENMHGKNIVRSASQGFGQEWKLRQEKLSGRHTTQWNELLKISCHG